MKQSNAGVVLAVVVCGIIVAFALGAVNVRWPWDWDALDVADTDTDIAYASPARVVRVEPVALDCRARVHAEVPVEGRKEHSFLGQVYRTDKVGIVAVGDVDTCVQSDAVQIDERDDGSFQVVIPGSAIEFVRPRVDAVATMDSVTYDQGFVGQLTDVFPWVSNDEGLTPAAYAFAQTVIGGSECMAQAYDLTRQLLLDAYRQQLIEQGANADDISVEILGDPDFGQNDDPPELDDDFEFEVDDGEVACEVAPDALGTGTDGADRPESR